MIQGIHHISMKTSNDREYAEVRRFYAELLELPIVKECDTCTLLNTGAGLVEIFRDGTGPAEKGVIRHFALSVDDVDAYIRAVREAGYPIIVEPKDVQIGGDPAFAARIGFCRGPLGEEIEFFCQGW